MQSAPTVSHYPPASADHSGQNIRCRACVRRWLCGLLAVLTLSTWTALVAAADDPEALAQIENLRAEIERSAAVTDVDAEDALAGFIQLERRKRALRALLGAAVNALDKNDDARTRARLTALVVEQFADIHAAIDRVRKGMDAVRAERLTAAADELLDLEYRLRDYAELESGLLRDWLDNIDRAERLGETSEAERSALDKALAARAETLSGRIELVLQRLQTSTTRLDDAPDGRKRALEAELSVLEERRARLVQGLITTVELMRERGMEVSGYARLLVTTTGEISGDVFSSEVLLGLVNDWLRAMRDAVARDGPGWFFKLLVFVVIIGAFKVLANIVTRIVRRAVSSSKMKFSNLLQDFFVTTAANAVLVLGVLIALSQLGVQLGPVLAGLGVAGFILGFALQETLSNFASGMMILIYRPFDVGDVVEAGGVSGKVNQMSLVSTTILTFDNQKLVVPNNKIWGDVIRNVNAEPKRRVDMTFGIGYEDDIASAQRVLETIIAEHALVLDDPAPTIRLHTLGESSVDFIVRPWVLAADYWTVYWDVTRAVKDRFDAEGISIPYPQRDVHLYQSQPE